MSEEADAMITGLKSSDDGSARRHALAAFGTAQEDVEDAVVAFHRDHGLDLTVEATSTTSTSTSTSRTTSILSGPAGGIVGMVKTGEAAGHAMLIGFDMGGTSTDVSHYAGTYERSFETEVAGVRMRAPMMDIHTVAAGGGSICRFDQGRFQVDYRKCRADDGGPDGAPLEVDLAANARSLGARVLEAGTLDDFARALGEAKAATETTVIVVRTDRMAGVSAGGAWWEVPVAEVSTIDAVNTARAAQQAGRDRQRCFHGEVVP